MLLDILRSVFARRGPRVNSAEDVALLFREGQVLRDRGLVLEAVKKYKSIVEIDCANSAAMNNLGSCFVDLQEEGEAAKWFERAIYVDDTCAPALVNYARQLTLMFRSAEAEKYLLRAGQLMPDSAYIDGVLASISLLRGESHEACELYLSAWLKDFDKSTYAHSYVFTLGYDARVSAERNYQEHVFWAGTVVDGNIFPSDIAFDDFIRNEWAGGKVKIGYISPDFRGHSVGFFFRPLLEGHNKQVVELYGYNDLVTDDKYTRVIRESFDVFRDVANVPDVELAQIIRDDKLDILVELAGHTGNHRIKLFMNKVARIQVTGLGYPLTTGVSGIDYKIVDEVSVPVGGESLYSEKLLRLPNSFWCFNPLEAAPAVAPAPAGIVGTITFGCFGNIAKISDEMLSAWAEIMLALPTSRLILKSITFQDESARASFGERLLRFNLDISRVRMDMPDSAVELFGRYAEIDIVLDTFPFNGGTTTCFALWMGVPLITVSGDALISRMGASMLSSLGLDELIASTMAEYVDVAIRLASDIERLAEMRSVIRQRMQASALGDGRIYAHDFEMACFNVLTSPEKEATVVRSVLPEGEVVRRANVLLDSGQLDAARRVIDYCLKYYPGSVDAIIQKSEIIEFTLGALAAKDYLLMARSAVVVKDVFAISVNVLRADLMLENYVEVESFVRRLELEKLDVVARDYVQMYQVAAQAWVAPVNNAVSKLKPPPFVSVLIWCGDDELFSVIKSCIDARMISGYYELIRAVGGSRAEGYANAHISSHSDIVLMLREDARVEAADFHQRLAVALERADLVGVLGADQLRGGAVMDAGEGHVFGARISAAVRRKEGFDCFVWGGRQAFRQGLQVIDPVFMAVKAGVFRTVSFDSGLYEGGGLCELDWTYRVFARGFNLAVAPGLGVACMGIEQSSGREWSECAHIFAGRYGVPVASWGRARSGGRAVPVASIKAGCEFLDAWFSS
jgi:protein O-GlcNAc transferase